MKDYKFLDSDRLVESYFVEEAKFEDGCKNCKPIVEEDFLDTDFDDIENIDSSWRLTDVGVAGDSLKNTEEGITTGECTIYGFENGEETVDNFGFTYWQDKHAVKINCTKEVFTEADIAAAEEILLDNLETNFVQNESLTEGNGEFIQSDETFDFAQYEADEEARKEAEAEEEELFGDFSELEPGNFTVVTYDSNVGKEVSSQEFETEDEAKNNFKETVEDLKNKNEGTYIVYLYVGFDLVARACMDEIIDDTIIPEARFSFGLEGILNEAVIDIPEDDEDKTYTEEEMAEYGIDENGYEIDGFDHYSHCKFCGELCPDGDMKRELNMGLLCDRCADELWSRGEKPVFVYEAWNKLNSLTEGQLSLPIYCGGSVTLEEDDETGKEKIYSIDLQAFSNWAIGKQIPKKWAKLFKDFIQEKIDNKTLYTPADMQDYPLIKRFQLFVNSNIAEHKIAAELQGTVLEGNDLLTVESIAKIGEDDYALADVTVDGMGIEVKVTKNNETEQKIFERAHRQPVVAVYVIYPGKTNHWNFYVRSSTGEYLSINNVLEHNYLNFDKSFIDIINNWQTKMQKTNLLPLVYIENRSDDGIKITKMQQY